MIKSLQLKGFFSVVVPSLLFYMFYTSHKTTLYSSIEHIPKLKKEIQDIKSISFAGAGWKLFYYIGVVKALQEIFPHEQLRNITYAGCSVGSLMSVSMLLNIRAEEIYEEWLQYAHNQRSQKHILDFLYTKQNCENYFNKFINNRCSPHVFQKLAISTTQFNPHPKNKIKTNFKDENHLKECLFRSSYIPIIMGNSFFYCNKFYFDGSITNNQPLNEQTEKENTLVISTYGTYSDIYPSTPIPMYWTFYPNSDENNRMLFDLGYRDTIRYFYGDDM